jgi:hypothetical protein
LQQRLVAFAAEQRRLIDIAAKSIDAIKTGSIGIAGPTGTLLTRTLNDLCTLTDQTLQEILVTSAGAKTASA